MARLQEENKSLQRQMSLLESPLWKTLHTVHCTQGGSRTYSAVPSLLYGSKNDDHIQGVHTAEDIQLFVTRQKQQVSFVVYKMYRCWAHKSWRPCRKSRTETKRKLSKGSSTPATTGEEMHTVSKSFSEAMGTVTELCEHGDNYYPAFKVNSVVSAPYLWYYDNRKELERAALRLSADEQEEFGLFRDYVLQNLGEEYEAVVSLLSKNRITARYFEYLYNQAIQ